MMQSAQNGTTELAALRHINDRLSAELQQAQQQANDLKQQFSAALQSAKERDHELVAC